MSSETNTTQTSTQEQTFNIDGKDYKRSELSQKCLNSIAIRQDLQNTRLRLSVELEKTDVLQKHYDGIIAEEIKSGDTKENVVK
jgi:hypothetical protein